MNSNALVAQLDRVTDYESVGQGFESLPAYQIGYLRVSDLFCFRDSKIQNLTRRGRVSGDGSTEPHLCFRPFPDENANKPSHSAINVTQKAVTQNAARPSTNTAKVPAEPGK